MKKDQLISDISDLNQLLIEELYWWTLEQKNSDFNPRNLLEISRNIHEKTFLLFHEFGSVKSEQPSSEVKPNDSSIKFEVDSTSQAEIEHIPVESIEEETELSNQDEVVEQKLETNTELAFEPIVVQEILPSIEKTTAAQSVAESFEGVKKDIPLADQLMNKSIESLTSAIGISEKFLFIHELFKGDTERYMLEISKLNDSKTGDQAYTYFSKLSQELNWDVKSHAFLEMKKLLTRKYH